jgi:hypothetical protein
VEQLAGAIAYNSELTERLNARLGSVMRPPSPQAVEKDGPLSGCPLAGQLRAGVDAINRTNRALNDILDRLEV